MNTAEILLVAILLIMFETFLLKGMVIMMDMQRIINMFGLSDAPVLAEGEGLAAIANTLIYLSQLIWWILRAAGAFIAIFFQMLATFVLVSMEFPILWVCNLPIMILLVYGLVSAIRVLGSGLGGGGD